MKNGGVAADQQGNEPVIIAPEQLRYALWLQWGGSVGLVLLIISFVAYVMGLSAPLISVDQLPGAWRLPADELLRVTAQTPGWGWVRLLDRGDVRNLVGIGLLASCSAAPLLAVVPIYLRRGDRIFATLCVLQVTVLALAASGLVGSGH
jgi:hypothetical protein